MPSPLYLPIGWRTIISERRPAAWCGSGRRSRHWSTRCGLAFWNTTNSDFPDDCNGNDGAPNYSTRMDYNLGPQPIPLRHNAGMGKSLVTGFATSVARAPMAGHKTTISASGLEPTASRTQKAQHLFKFGGEIHDTLFSGSKSLTNDNGTFAFGKHASQSPLAVPRLYRISLPALSSTGRPSWSETRRFHSLSAYNRYALFAQDDWRIRPRVTLNLGVRWEYVQPISTSQ